MSISIEQVPQNVNAEVSAWAMRMLIIIAADSEEKDAEIEDLKKTIADLDNRLKQLESTP